MFSSPSMDPRDKQKLQRNYAKLLDVNYAAISPHLISTFVLTLEMHDEIECRPTERKKMEKLLSILPTRGGNTMKELINSLKPAYRWIAQVLEGDDNDLRASRSRNDNNNNRNRNPPDISIASHLREITKILRRSPQASTHWTFMAYSMGLLPTTIMDIKRDMSTSGGHQYAIFSVLEAWVGKVASQATFSELVLILRREDMNLCAEEVTEYWASVTDYREYPMGPRRRQAGRSRSRSPIITDV